MVDLIKENNIYTMSTPFDRKFELINKLGIDILKIASCGTMTILLFKILKTKTPVIAQQVEQN